MNINHPPIKTVPLKKIFCDWPAWEGMIACKHLLETARQVHDNHGQLLTLYGSDERSRRGGFLLHLVFIFWKQCTLHLRCPLSESNPEYPDLSHLFPVTVRLQRALFDLFGFKAVDSDDQRPWLRHNAWPADVFVLRKEVRLTELFPQTTDHYPFVRVGGEGVHEIPVGPVHAGIIEPGHFRFNVVGERILRLEEQFGYTHKGIAKHFQKISFVNGAKLAGRVSGDSTVAYAWAYCMALENLHFQTVPPRAQWLRALFLERERIMNHLGDLGALGNDAGLEFAYNQFSSLKEKVLRLNDQLFSHRYLMDMIIPGGVAMDISSSGIINISHEIQTLRSEISTLWNIYMEHEGLQDRFVTTGIIKTELAQQLGLLGLSARASGLCIDWRQHMSHSPYHLMAMHVQTESAGDVAARVTLRFKEIEESLRLIDIILTQLPKGKYQTILPAIAPTQLGIGCVEGWRGPIFVTLFSEEQHHIAWANLHDSSWQNWPALEHAVIGNIVPDFPLINKSFNFSYSGHDG